MPESKKILLLGAGGHCLSVLESLITTSNYDEIGIIDKEASIGTPLENAIKVKMGISILGDDDALMELYSQGYKDAFITVGSIGYPDVRKKLYQLVKQIGFHIPNIIDKSSVVSQYASLGEGIYIGKKAVVNSCATINNCAIINTSSVIEHGCIIEDFVHVAPGSILNGNVTIGKDAHIGAGSVIKQGICIGAESMIGLGSVVLRNIGSNVTAYGNPCKEVKHE